MDSEYRNRLWSVGTFFGFEVTIDGVNYLKFVKSTEDFAVIVVYDYTQRLYEDNVIYMIIECKQCMFDFEVIKDFNSSINNATMFIEKIKEYE